MPSFLPPRVTPPYNHRRDSYYLVCNIGPTGGASSLFGPEANRIAATSPSKRSLTDDHQYQHMVEQIRALELITSNWSDEGSPSPNQLSVQLAREILETVTTANSFPERIQASADGGVGFTYVGEGPNRAMIEASNDGERFLLLYDTDGNTSVLDWNEAFHSEVVRVLRRHLEGRPLAADRF